MALAYSLTINGSILTAPVVGALNAKIDPILGTEPSIDVDASVMDVSLDIGANANGTYTSDVGSVTDAGISNATISVTNTPTDAAIDPGINAGIDTCISTDTYNTATGAATPSDLDAVSTSSSAGLDVATASVLSVGTSTAGGLLSLMQVATKANYSELTSFSLTGTLLYEEGAIASTTTNGNNANEFVLNAGTPFNPTLQTGELNLVSNTALFSYFGLAASNLDVVNISSAVDPVTGMEEVSITFDPSVADAADYNFFYPFLASASYSPANIIEITGGEMLLTFSADLFMVEGSINVYGTDGTTNYLYSAELFGSVVSGYVGFAETGPPDLS